MTFYKLVRSRPRRGMECTRNYLRSVIEDGQVHTCVPGPSVDLSVQCNLFICTRAGSGTRVWMWPGQSEAKSEDIFYLNRSKHNCYKSECDIFRSGAQKWNLIFQQDTITPVLLYCRNNTVMACSISARSAAVSQIPAVSEDAELHCFLILRNYYRNLSLSSQLQHFRGRIIECNALQIVFYTLFISGLNLFVRISLLSSSLGY